MIEYYLFCHCPLIMVFINPSLRSPPVPPLLLPGSAISQHILAAVRDLQVTVLPVVPSIAASVERVMRGSPELRPKELRTVHKHGRTFAVPPD